MKKLRDYSIIATFVLVLVDMSSANGACLNVQVWTTSDDIVGEVVTVNLFDVATKKLAQSWQVTIVDKKPQIYTRCAEEGEYIVRYSGMGMAWQEYQNLLINDHTVLHINMKPGEDGRILLISEPFEVKIK